MKYIKLGEICKFINGDRGKNYPSGKDIINTGIPFINAGHLQKKGLDMENMNYISEKKYESLGSGKVEKYDILYCLRGSLGKNSLCLIDKGAIASSLLILRPNTNLIYTKYLMFYLNSNTIQEEIRKANNGSSQPNLSASSVKEFEVLYPEYSMQIKIGNVLEKAQGIIDKRKEQIEALDELVKSKFIEMFGDLKCEEKKALSECTSFIDYRGKTPILAETGIRMINAKSVGTGYFKYVDEFISEDTYNEWMKRGFPKAGDVLFVTEGHTFGNVCTIPNNFKKFAMGQRVITIQGSEKILNNSFLLHYMQSIAFKVDIDRYKTGSSAQGIRSKELQKILIPIPNFELQNQFADFVKQVDKLKNEMQNSLKELEDNFDSLMQRAFKGELF